MSEIKNYVEIHFDIDFISVDGDSIVDFSELTVDSMLNPPSKKEKITSIVWDVEKKNYPTKGVLFFSEPINENGESEIYFNEEEKYNDWVQPFVDVWQAEKDRIEQEQQEALEQYNQIQNVKSRAMNYVNQTWDSIEETASVESSLGYTIGVSEKDIKFYTARIETMEDTETVTFKDYHNIERTGVTKANFVTMRKEAYAKYLNLLNIKSEYEANIEQCSTKEQVISLISQLNVFNPSLAPVTDI